MESKREDIVVSNVKGLNVAAVGCSHGYLDRIYKTVGEIEKSRNIKIDLLLCNGDFEACRGPKDLDQLAGPTKYHFLKDFHEYHKGLRKAPVLTIFIGGNHEGSNYLWELFYGGWVCPNIYYMGMAGVLNYGGIRIMGFSGVFKNYDFRKGHYEIPPLYDEGMKRSIYHVRAYELFKLSLVTNKIDVIMSHDWPHDMVRHGDVNTLIRQKPHFEDQIRDEELGCKEYTKLLKLHKPQYWVSGHMHVYFKAVIPHENNKNTVFLALDKAEDRKPFMDAVSFPDASGPKELTYDREWLAILRATHSLHGFTSNYVNLPTIESFEDGGFVEKELEWVNKNIKDEDLKVPYNFTSTYDYGIGMTNPQSDQFIRLVDLTPSIYDQYKQLPKPSSSSNNSPEYKPRSYDRNRNKPYKPRSKDEDSGERKGSFGGRGRGKNYY